MSYHSKSNYNSEQTYRDRDGDRDSRGRKRSHSRSRSRSSSRDRKRRDQQSNYRGDMARDKDYDRDRNRDRDHRGDRYRDRGVDHNNRNYNSNSSNNQPTGGRLLSEPSNTVVIKGLPLHINESSLYAILGPYYAQEIRLINKDNEAKLVAFVDFPSMEYAQYFMSSFAGSAGDPQAAQLIIENRAVGLDFARPLDKTNQRQFTMGATGSEISRRPIRTDWICDSCSCHNFAKRDFCFRCNLPRTENAISVNNNQDTIGDNLMSSETPCTFLLIRGFGSHITEEQIMELFRQFAYVKSCVIVRDQPGRPPSKGLAFVEFQTVEHAAYALQNSNELKIDFCPVKVAYAKESVMRQLISQQQALASNNLMRPYAMSTPGLHNQLVASAMQAAQWSLNNGYGGGIAGNQPASSHAPVLLKPVASQWPPNFDTNGTAYVFQPKSGYFLEPITEFYYCPKSKLYYSAKDGIYYHYDTSLDPPFHRFNPPIPTEPEEIQITTSDSQTNKELEESEANRSTAIAFTMNTKIKMKPNLGPAKKVMKDLAKWEAIQKENEAEIEAEQIVLQSKKVVAKSTLDPLPPSKHINESATTGVTPSSNTHSTVSTQPTPSQATSTATGGQSICLLCRRQFNSPEMLARHEKESKLHAENLAKVQAQQQAAAAKPQYRDRAEERRELFGSVPDHIPAKEVQEEILLTPVAFIPPPPPPMPPTDLSSDSNNVGNNLLKKMGWKDGQGLGRENDGKIETVATELEISSSHGNMNQTISYTKAANGTSSVSGSGYKDNLLSIARARFEELSKK